MSKNKTNFLVQGSILAMAGILVRVIGIIYRVPVQNILGTEGTTYYSAAYDVYSLFLLISSIYTFFIKLSKYFSFAKSDSSSNSPGIPPYLKYS